MGCSEEVEEERKCVMGSGGRLMKYGKKAGDRKRSEAMRMEIL